MKEDKQKKQSERSRQPEPAETAAAAEKKQTRKQKKLARRQTQEQQIALEKQLVKEGKILPRTRYTPKGYLGRILAVLLAFLFGMLVVIGGLLGGGYYLAITPSRNLLGMFIDNADEIISEEYLDKSVIDIVSDISDDVSALSDPNNLSFNMLAKYSPLVDTYLDSLISQLSEMGVDVDKDEVAATSFASLGSYLTDDLLPNIELGKVLSSILQEGETLDGLLMALCYGEEGVDYTIDEAGEVVMLGDSEPTSVHDLMTDASTIVQRVPLESVLGADATSEALIRTLCYGTEGTNEEGGDYQIIDGEIVMNEGKEKTTIGYLMNHPTELLDGITVDAVIDITADSGEAILYLAYGTEGVNYEIVDSEIVMLEDPLTGKPYPKRTIGDLTGDDIISNATIGSLVSIDENSTGILVAIQDWTIGDLTQASRIESLKLSQLITIDESSARILQAMADWSISDLTSQSAIDSLTLGDVITITEDSAQLLKSLADTRIGSLGEAVNTLRLRDFLSEESLDSNNILKNLKDSTLETLASDVSSLTVAQVFGSELYSYLDMSENGTNGKTYEMLVSGYKPNDEANGEADSDKLRPNAMDIPADQITQQRVLTSDGETEVLYGYFRTADGAYTLAEESEVYRHVAESETGETEYTYYINSEIDLIPSATAWQYVDYDNGGTLTALPEGDRVATEVPSDYTLQPVKATATPYSDEDGNGYYYLTARVHVRDGEPAEEKVAYTLCVDEGGVYYYSFVLEQETNDAGELVYKDYSSMERVDLEEVVTAYTIGGETAVFDEETGDVLYEGGSYSLRTGRVTDGSGETSTRYYIVVEESVTPSYYYETNGAYTLVNEANTELKWTAQTDEGTTVPVDRYLSGVWYLLFGVEACSGAEGECTHGTGGAALGEAHSVLVDNTVMPVLEIAGEVSAVAQTINTLPLWEMWLHEFIDENPYQKLGFTFEYNGSEYTNLNELTVSGTISLLKSIISGEITLVPDIDPGDVTGGEDAGGTGLTP